MKVLIALQPELVLEPVPADAHLLRAPVFAAVEELHEVRAGGRRRETSNPAAAGEGGEEQLDFALPICQPIYSNLPLELDSARQAKCGLKERSNHVSKAQNLNYFSGYVKLITF